MRRISAVALLGAAALAIGACAGSSDGGEDPSDVVDGAESADEAAGDVVELTIESWSTPDEARWNDVILPAFEAANPGIDVSFEPTTGTEYDSALRTRLGGGVAGDIIQCRAFDGSLQLFDEGYLEPLDELPVVGNYTEAALTAWRTDDQSTTFCLPLAGSIHGFIYNADAFAELGIEAPETEDEFFAALEAIKADGTYTPLAMGAADSWTVGSMGYENIAPNYYAGEEGRLGLIDGTKKFTDPEFVKPFEELARWQPYMPDGFEAVAYTDAQQLFTQGRAAIYPAGSWEIVGFNDSAEFELGFFKAPVPTGADKCYTNFHTDSGIGMNAATEHPDEVKTFLDWIGSEAAAELLNNELTGQVPLSTWTPAVTDPLLQQFLSATTDCETTIRPTYQRLSRGEPSATTELWNESVEVLKGTKTPADAAADLQASLDSWYEPESL